MLVTGAAGGIGSAICRRVAQDGAHIVATDIDIAGAEQLTAYLNQHFGAGRAIAVKMYVTNEESVQAAFKRAALAFGGIDVIVNNAGLASSAPVTETSLAEWNKNWNVLATGYFLVAREGFRLLQVQGRGGNLVFIASKQESLAANFTNEGGVFGTTRYLKNVMGLWLLQECQRCWSRDGHAIDYDTLLADVDAVPAFAALIDPDDPRFLAPQNMPGAIDAYLLEHGQAPLAARAGFARCIMESLVLRYRAVFQQISHLTGAIINQVHVVGGGARNARLNQWLADALEVPVIAGPYEATAQGNALMQLVGLGKLHNLEEVRAIARNTPTQVYSPRSAGRAAWEEAEQRFSAMTSSRVR